MGLNDQYVCRLAIGALLVHDRGCAKDKLELIPSFSAECVGELLQGGPQRRVTQDLNLYLGPGPKLKGQERSDDQGAEDSKRYSHDPLLEVRNSTKCARPLHLMQPADAQMLRRLDARAKTGTRVNSESLLARKREPARLD